MNSTTVFYGKRFRDLLAAHKVKVVGFVSAAAMTASASAATFDINATVGPLLESVSALIPTIINLIIAVVPAIIVMAVVGFLVGFLDRILKLIKI